MDHLSNQEVLGSLMVFSVKVHDKWSKEAGETMVDFIKQVHKQSRNVRN